MLFLKLYDSEFLGNQYGGFYVKAILVIAGTVGAFAAVQTGEIARGLIEDDSLDALLDLHKNFATFTLHLFSFIAIAYIFAWLKRDGQNLWLKIPSGITKVFDYYSQFVLYPPLVIILSIIGVIAITITGALGGAVVYGPEGDPVIKIIYNIFL